MSCSITADLSQQLNSGKGKTEWTVYFFLVARHDSDDWPDVCYLADPMHLQSPAGFVQSTVEGGSLCFQLLHGHWLHCNTLCDKHQKVKQIQSLFRGKLQFNFLYWVSVTRNRKTHSAGSGAYRQWGFCLLAHTEWRPAQAYSTTWKTMIQSVYQTLAFTFSDLLFC